VEDKRRTSNENIGILGCGREGGHDVLHIGFERVHFPRRFGIGGRDVKVCCFCGGAVHSIGICAALVHGSVQMASVSDNIIIMT